MTTWTCQTKPSGFWLTWTNGFTAIAEICRSPRAAATFKRLPAGSAFGLCSKLAGEVRFDDLPLISEAVDWAKQGTKTGATDRNWKGYGHDVRLASGAPDWQRAIVTDPQTSGGLLVACAPEAEKDVLAAFSKRGFAEARRIGKLSAGEPKLTVL